ncbi:SAP domain-containing ribonucleoprotein-like [Ailuropoda melanoleuca]|uniref:SAP domain-containing ribonucleoprotein-like n=1 Tax=Ailuropoda melanoleuca TaxID=9646 RepID=UPI001494BE27|nr:SAP domain-containing ribonucleoprotein-like [Ailuropoda melanoleuca]
MAGAGGSDGEALVPRMEIIEMSDELRRNKQEIVNGLNIFLEENEEEEVSLEELEEEFDILEEEETETISEDGSSKEAHDIVRTPQKVSLRNISSMTDEERLNMRIKKFGIITNEEFRKSPGNSCFGFNMSAGKEVNTDMEKKRKRLERFGLL